MTLDKWLEKEGLTQAQFGKMLGVDHVSVNRYVNRKSRPTKKIMDRIMAITKGQVTPNDIYMPPPPAELA